ncbi:InlB B-repeat-containing protein [uncultured Treponema sp.]|uniref:pectate lyase family protein n=1 Tax=uncultured Treponema sp. TaxID=162155 RepID=UPI00262D60D6|nr:InlB B-repeat-containing protein [uncultured Treponema sp.]
MKKTFFRAIKKFFAAMALVSLAACSDLSVDSDDAGSPIAKGEKATVTFNLSTPDRTVYPKITLSDYAYKITVDTENAVAATLSEDSKLSAEVEAGEHTFKVEAFAKDTDGAATGSAILTGSKTATISTSEATVSIVLVGATGATGSVSVTLPFALEVQAVKAGIYDTPAGDAENAVALTITNGSVVFADASVDSGKTKYVIFYLYSDESATKLICPYVVPVYIVAGLTTTSTEPTLGAATFTATVTMQKNGSDWANSGATVKLVNGSDEVLMVADSGAATYTANGETGTTYTVYVNGTATEKTVSASATAASVNYLVPALYPAHGATDAFADTQLILTFVGEPTLKADSSVVIKNGDTAIDTISADADETQSTQGGQTVNVGNKQLVRVDGKNVYIQPHYNGTTSATKLQPSTTYTVDISDFITVPSGYDGILAAGDTSIWSFTTKTAPAVSTTMTVSNATSENTADFFSVYGAMFAVATSGSTNTTYQFNIADGTYYELVSVKPKNGQTFIVHGKADNTKGDSVVIEYVNNQHLNNGSDIRTVYYQAGGNLIFENVTLKNLTERKVSYSKDGLYGGNTSASGTNNHYQAETLYFNSQNGQLSAYNSSFVSLQDTLLTKGKVWFYDCHIEGDVDFMWGYSDVALFENCDIVCKYDSNVSSPSAYLFETRVGTPASSGVVIGKGYVLLNSTVTVENGVTAYFARRASERPASDTYYDQAALVNVTVDGSLDSAHWYVYTGNANKSYIPCGISSGTKYGTFADVGWKEYNVKNANDTVLTPSEATTYGGVITTAEYNSEYNGRRAILNRFYDVDAGVYVKDSKTNWDIDTLISARGYTVASDSSIVDASAYIVGDGGTITDSDNIARADSLAITSTETPSGYAGVNWTSPTYDSTVVEVSTPSAFKTAVEAGGKIVVVNGMIDMTTGYNGNTMLPTTGGDTTAALDAFVNAKSSGAYTNYAAWKASYAAACTTTTEDSSDSKSGKSDLYDMLWKLNNAYKNVVQVAVKSNTMIIGADSNSGIRGGTFSISGESYITIRNLKIQDAYDPFPHHESGDGYNGERDGIVIQGESAHIWIDHCTLEDTLTPDHVKTAGTTNEKWQNYDGLLDIKGTGAYITVSYNKFKNHDKTSLIGSGDSEGSNSTRLITYHHNYFYNCGQRMPMVRNTTLHTYNNVYAYSKGDYSQQYAIGPRSGVIIYAENNYFGSGISYAFKGAAASAIHASGNVLNNGSTENEENVNYNGVSQTDSTKFSEQTSPAYTYDVDAISTITDNSTGVAAKSGTGDATVDGTAYGSSTGTGTTFIEITFSANAEDATITTSTQSVASGTATALKTATALGLTRSGYSFSGWATSSGGEVVYADGASVNITDALTLYAVWGEESVTVTWDWTTAAVTLGTTTSNFSSETTQIQSITGYAKGDSDTIFLTINATSGKLANRTDDAQFNSGTIIKIPVSNGSVVTANVYSTAYELAGNAASSATSTYTASKAGYVVLKSTGSNYLNKIVVTGLYANDDFSSDIVDFVSDTATVTNNDATLGLTAVTDSTSSSNTSVATVSVTDEGVVITSVAVGTAIITAGDGTNTATIPVTVGDYGAISIGTITPYSASSVLDSVVWDMDGTNTLSFYSDVSCETALSNTTIQSGVGYVAGTSPKLPLYVDCSTIGKFAYTSGQYVQTNNGTKIYVPVSSGSVVSITMHSNASAYQYVNVGSNTLTMTADTCNYTAGASGYVLVELSSAASGAYMLGITVTNVDYSTPRSTNSTVSVTAN